jgi:murein L,D-transpeptidase YcbB/YkuD
MPRRIVIAIATLALVGAYGLTGLVRVHAQTLSTQVSEHLRQRLEAMEIPLTLSVAGEPIYASVLLPRFYAQRRFRAAWSDYGAPVPQVEALLHAIRDASYEGLDPQDYHLTAIESMIGEIRRHQERQEPLDPARLGDLDLLLSDALLTYGTHLLVGRTNPQVHDTTWFADNAGTELVDVLQRALDTDRVREALHSLVPPHAGYTRLRQALAWYRRIAADGGWPTIAAGPALRQGDRDQRVIALRSRLWTTGDLAVLSETGTADLFDATLEQAVQTFQQRHGLEDDGVVGPVTRAALNVPVEARLHQIVLNMERWRWLPRQLGPRYIQINIPDFTLAVMEYGQAVMTMRVVVGTPTQPTPVFSGTMTYLVLSPFWQVPPSIAKREILPRLRQNPEYLATHNMKVLQGWGAETRDIDPQSIDWATITRRNFRYRLRQEPGPENALGRVKFMFPNRYKVYMHDTPSRELFAKPVRAFSHGCVRLENPLALVEYVLRDDSRWTREEILAGIARGAEQYIRLPQSIPVHLVYRTTWIDTAGTVQFRPDIYGHDTPSEAAFCAVVSCG